jgi:NAD-dependent SIR2 family protein deacetylase
VAKLQEKYDVTVVTQNVDNLHEMAGSKDVIHLHGELMKVCSSRDPYNPHFIQTLTADNPEVVRGHKGRRRQSIATIYRFFRRECADDRTGCCRSSES